MISLHEITQPEDIEAFCRRYSLESGTLLEAAHIPHSRFFGVFKSGELLGGFALRSEGIFRAISSIVSAGERGFVQKKVDGAVEVSGLWLSRKARSAGNRSFMMYSILQMVKKLGFDRMIGITTKRSIWEKTYAPLGARVLFEGPTEIIKGNVKPGIVFETRVNEVLYRMPLYFLKRLPSLNLGFELPSGLRHGRNF